MTQENDDSPARIQRENAVDTIAEMWEDGYWFIVEGDDE